MEMFIRTVKWKETQRLEENLEEVNSGGVRVHMLLKREFLNSKL